MKFYAVVPIEKLAEVYREGLPPETSVTDDIHIAEDRAWADEEVILEVEVKDPDALLAADSSEVEHWSNILIAEAVLVHQEEVPPGKYSEIANPSTGEVFIWADPGHEEDARALAQLADEGGWRESIEAINWAETMAAIPAENISLTGPVDFGEIENQGEYNAAVEAMEPVGLTSLGANFWVWLLLLTSRIFGAGYGATSEEAAEEKAAEKAQARKQRRKKRPKKPKMAGSFA